MPCSLRAVVVVVAVAAGAEAVRLVAAAAVEAGRARKQGLAVKGVLPNSTVDLMHLHDHAIDKVSRSTR